MTASLRAAAADSTRAHPPAAATNSASPSARRSPISGNEPSNIPSIVAAGYDKSDAETASNDISQRVLDMLLGFDEEA